MEQALSSTSSCRLMALNLYSFVNKPFTDEAEIDYEKLYEISYEQLRLGDNLVDLEIEYIQRIIDKIKSDPESDEIKRDELELWVKAKNNASKDRRVGLGLTALADMFAALNVRYGSPESIEIAEKVMKTKMEAELDATIDLSILRGSFDGWDRNKEFRKIDVFADGNSSLVGENSFYTFLRNTFPKHTERMYDFGRRNLNFSTIAPTGSVSLLAQTSSGLEPLFMPFYMRRKKINDREGRIDFVDDNGDKWQEFPVLHPKFKDWMLLNDKFGLTTTVDDLTNIQLSNLFKKSPWYNATANDIHWKERINLQAILQKYTTNAISSTINLPKGTSYKEVSDIYKYGYKKKLKGQTVYVDGSRDGVLVSNKTSKKEEFDYSQSPKRFKELKAHAHTIQVAGTKYAVFVGFMNEKPYEVFVYEGYTKNEGGTLVREAQGEYYFVGNDKKSKHRIITDKMDVNQKLVSRLVSRALRHGSHFRFIVEDIEKVGAGIFDWSTAIKKALAKYLKSEDITDKTCPSCGSNSLLFEEGCKTCKSCGYSACG